MRFVLNVDIPRDRLGVVLEAVYESDGRLLGAPVGYREQSGAAKEKVAQALVALVEGNTPEAPKKPTSAAKKATKTPSAPKTYGPMSSPVFKKAMEALSDVQDGGFLTSPELQRRFLAADISPWQISKICHHAVEKGVFKREGNRGKFILRRPVLETVLTSVVEEVAHG